MPAEIDEVLLERRVGPRVRRAVRRDARVNRLEVLDDVVDRELPQAEALVLEPRWDVEVVGYEPPRFQKSWASSPAAAPTWSRPSFVTMRPRGVRWMKPSCSRYGS